MVLPVLLRAPMMRSFGAAPSAQVVAPDARGLFGNKPAATILTDAPMKNICVGAGRHARSPLFDLRSRMFADRDVVVDVPDGQFERIAALAIRANGDVEAGSDEYDPDGGLLTFKRSLDVEGDPLSAELAGADPVTTASLV